MVLGGKSKTVNILTNNSAGVVVKRVMTSGVVTSVPPPVPGPLSPLGSFTSWLLHLSMAPCHLLAPAPASGPWSSRCQAGLPTTWNNFNGVHLNVLHPSCPCVHCLTCHNIEIFFENSQVFNLFKWLDLNSVARTVCQGSWVAKLVTDLIVQ